MSKINNLLLATMACMIISTSLAQETKVGIRLGLGLPNLRSADDNIYSKDYSSVAGFDGGFFLDYGLTENFSIKAELAYAQRGGERNGIQPIPSSTLNRLPEGQALEIYLQQAGIETIYADFNNESIFSYIDIPILAKYEWHLDDKWGVYANAGPYVSFIISPEQEVSSADNLPIYVDENGTPLMVPYPPDFMTLGPAFAPEGFNTTEDINKDIANMDFGAMLGIGVSYAINDTSELLFDARGSYGFIPLQNDTDLYGSVHMGTISFSLGYAYTLKNKSKKDNIEE